MKYEIDLITNNGVAEYRDLIVRIGSDMILVKLSRESKAENEK